MFKHLQSKFSAIKSFSFEAEAKLIVEQNEDELVELQQRQLYAGKDKNGNRITLDGNPNYAPFTIKEKIRKGQSLIPNWKDTGILYASLRSIVRSNKFKFESDNFKFAIMQARSPEATGLNAASANEFKQTVSLPAIRKVIKEKIYDV